MNRLKSTVLLSCVLLAPGCTPTNGKTSPDGGRGTASGAAKGATVGAVTGAALGGGIGAIVGSTSGHVGEGLWVGALAGGAAGAGVGAAVGDYRQKTASRADSTRDQENQYRQQKRELDSVKDSLGDEMSSRSRSGSTIASSTILSSNTGGHGQSGFGGSTRAGAGMSGYGVMEGYHGNPNARPYRPGASDRHIPTSVLANHSSSSGKIRHEQFAVSTSRGRGRLADTAVHDAPAHGGNYRNSGVIAPASQKTFAAKNTAPLASSEKKAESFKTAEPDLLEPKLGGENDFATVDEPPIRAVGGAKGGTVAKLDGAKPEVAKVDTLPEAKATTAKTANGAASGITEGAADTRGAVVAKQLGKLPADANASCIQAEKEAARASNATSDADRLFYLGRASRLCPTSDTYQVELGKVFAKIGKVQEAKVAFKKAADMNPQNDAARDELSILENSAQ